MKRLLSIMLALMLVLSIAATAFAADKVTTTTPEAWLTKTFNAIDGRETTFSFDVAETHAGTAPKLTIGDITFTDTDKGTTTKASQLVFGEPTEVGTFEYFVTENSTFKPALTDPTHEKMIMSKAQYKVSIGVEQVNGALKITSIAVSKVKDDVGNSVDEKVDYGNPGEGQPNSFKFTNTYVREAGSTGPYPGSGSLKISKTVVGGKDDTQKFTFKAVFEIPEESNPFGNPFTPKAVVVHTDSTTTNVPLQQKTDGTLHADFSLANGEYLKVTGLPEGTLASVTEIATPNFKPSASMYFDGAKVVQDPVSTGQALIISDKTLGDAENSIAVTNTYDYTPPTGVILNVLPYVLMVAIAGGMIVLFTVMKRRKAQDYED